MKYVIESAFIEGKGIKNYARTYQIEFKKTAEGTREEEKPIWTEIIMKKEEDERREA